jgi:signal transduction histidine kinase
MEELKQDHEKHIMTTQLEIQENTLQHIAREIHDNINLSLTLAKLHLNTLDWEDKTNSIIKIGNSIHLLTQTIHELSNISKSFHQELINNHGLIKALEKEIQRISETGLFKVDFSVAGEPVFLDTQRELIIFRVIQEAFNNIIKHADASNTELKLVYHGQDLDIIVRDNGKGISRTTDFLTNPNNRAGLKNMHTRAYMLGGTMKIESLKTKGTAVSFNIPYQ